MNRAEVREGIHRNLRGPEFDQLRLPTAPGMVQGLAIMETFAVVD